MIFDIKSTIMSTKQHEAASKPLLENHLRERRQSLGLSQKQLADMAGITRQAVCAVEANQYSPATSVALLLARALRYLRGCLLGDQEDAGAGLADAHP